MIVLRTTTSADARAVERIAQLDSRPVPPGPHLVAIRDGKIEAVLSITAREVIANPFVPTADLSDLLRVHAAAQAREPAGRRPHPRPIAVTA